MTELEQLKQILKEHSAEFCTCGHEIGFGDIAWNEGQTEAGTPASYVEIQCVLCQRDIAWVHSWTIFDEDYDRMVMVLKILKEDWKIKKGSL